MSLTGPLRSFVIWKGASEVAVSVNCRSQSALKWMALARTSLLVKREGAVRLRQPQRRRFRRALGSSQLRGEPARGKQASQ